LRDSEVGHGEQQPHAGLWMVALLGRMLDLHKKLAAATIPADKKLYRRRIEATDDEIDALVYELYGLTEEEIALVERWWQRLGTID